jgi:hypothetical protein
MHPYPTKEEIMDHEVKHKPEVIIAVKEWKKESWLPVRAGNLRDKAAALEILVNRIAGIYEKPVSFQFNPDTPIGCHYKPKEKILVVDKSCSIISTLHELAHHLFGSDEHQACRWSVWLFKKTFPKAYSQLVWQEHMLVKSCPSTPGLPSPSTD